MNPSICVIFSCQKHVGILDVVLSKKVVEAWTKLVREFRQLSQVILLDYGAD